MWLRSHYSGRVLVVAFSRSRSLMRKLHHQHNILRLSPSSSSLRHELGHSVLFYPKFHCELNFIERYWCQVKWFARENCGYDFEELNATVPEALASVTNASIRGFYRLAGSAHH